VAIPSSFKGLAGEVLEVYPKMPEHRLEAEIRRIAEISSSTKDLIGKRILDLGCGSAHSADGPGFIARSFFKVTGNQEALTKFHPWYCRVLHVGKAHSVGVDIASNSQEPFENYSLDILDPAALRGFEDKSFDAVNNYKLTVPKESRQKINGTSPHIFLSLLRLHQHADVRYFREQGMPLSKWSDGFLERNAPRMYEINNRVFTEVQRILREGGIYTLAEFVFRKKNGFLKKQKTMTGLGS
jgi:SAM-dependent methyltransferase